LHTLVGDDFFVDVTRIALLQNIDAITPAEFAAFVDDAEHLPKLRYLHFREGSDPMIKLVCERLVGLETLNIPSSRLDDDCLRHVASLSNLKQLGVWETRITGNGFAHLGKLTNLETLLIQRAKVTNSGLTTICRLEMLRKLSLDGNRDLTDGGIKQVANLKRLESLNLTNCPHVTDESIDYLRGLESLTELRGFDFNPRFPAGKIPVRK
jgi:hypothetical protein